jgi:hypothetical protein
MLLSLVIKVVFLSSAPYHLYFINHQTNLYGPWHEYEVTGGHPPFLMVKQHQVMQFCSSSSLMTTQQMVWARYVNISMLSNFDKTFFCM